MKRKHHEYFTPKLPEPLIAEPIPTNEPCYRPIAYTQVKKTRLPLSHIAIAVIAIKLEDKYAALIEHATALGATIVKPSEASVLITSIRSPDRLKRHVDLNVVKTRPIHVVTPAWLDAVHEYQAPAAFESYYTNRSIYDTLPSARHDEPSDLDPDTSGTHLGSPSSSVSTSRSSQIRFDSKLATNRLSPLVCPNQKLVEELRVISEWRKLCGEQQSHDAYSRAVSVMKAYPKVIENVGEVKKIPSLGGKMVHLITEYLHNKEMYEASQIRMNPKYASLRSFTSIHGIGPTKACELYAQGCRTFADLERHYDEWEVQSGKRSMTREALKLRDDLAAKIPRAEVEAIAQTVHVRLERLQSGWEYTICGGYRRGKGFSNDVDIIFTHPEMTKEDDQQYCQQLVEKLTKEGIITHVLQISSWASKSESRDATHIVALDKALLVMRLPDAGHSIHRRVDLIFAPFSGYWNAVVGWTGSTQFERDLRRHAKARGMKFDNGGMYRRNDSRPVLARSEQEVFDVLGLPFIPPHLRNAD